MANNDDRIQRYLTIIQNLTAELVQSRAELEALKQEHKKDLAQKDARIAILEERVEELKIDSHRTVNTLNNLRGYEY